MVSDKVGAIGFVSRRSGARILVDGVALGKQMKGVGKYVANSLWQLSEIDLVNEYWILLKDNIDPPQLPQNARFHYVSIRFRNHMVHGLGTLPWKALQLNADLVWIPYETTLGIFHCPYVVVCHDIAHKIVEAQYAAGRSFTIVRRLIFLLDGQMVNYSLHRAATVFYNSQFVENWLMHSIGIANDKLEYAPCAPGSDFAHLAEKLDRQDIRRQLQCLNGYLLAIATGDQRENLDTVLAVYDKLIGQKIGQNLVIAGVRTENETDVRCKVDQFGWRARVKILPFYRDDQVSTLAEIYAGADLYLDLSLHEGFGMQVIEAMACGTAVICSNRGALPEVVGDAALLVDPLETTGIVDAVLCLLSDTPLRLQLIDRGSARAAQFTWRRTAEAISQRMAWLLKPN